MDSAAAVDAMLDRVRARPWGLVVGALDRDGTSVRRDEGSDALTDASAFDWGSITKTLTGVLLAGAIVRGEVRAEDRLADLLDVSGAAGDITLHELAVQRSGLPRLPPNIAPVDAGDPYAAYGADDLLEGLAQVEVGPKEDLYSNFGFMVLGEALSVVAGQAYADLLQQRVLGPLGMIGSGCPPDEAVRVPGYSGPEQVPWWSAPLPGAGGVGGPMCDLLSYLQATVQPPAGTLGEAIGLATGVHTEGSPVMGYGWVHQGGGLWHNGGTGGFRAFAALHRPSGTAVGLLANSRDADIIDRIGFAVLTEMITG